MERARWCSCGTEITASGCIVAAHMGKRVYYKVECPKCGVPGPVGNTKPEAVLKWNHYREHIEKIKRGEA